MEVGRLTGAFDLLTTAQLDVVAQARARCTSLLARVLTDEELLRRERVGPVMPLDERVRLVAALRDVDAAEVATGDEPDEAEVHGSTYAFRPAGVEPADTVVLRPGDEPAVLPEVDDLLVVPGPREAGVRVGYVPGGWDLFHVGHLTILERARSRCDRLVVGVVTDEALTRAKGRAPMVPFGERAAVVAAMAVVDDVVADTSSNKLRAWERLGFDVLFKGDDWRGTPKGERLEAEMAQVGVELQYFPYTPHTSSTALRSVLGAR